MTNDSHNDRIRQLEQQVRELRDLVRHFTRLPTLPPGASVPKVRDRCAARAKGAFTTSTATITVDNVTVETENGKSPLTDPDDLAEELSVKNRYGYEGDDNDDMTIAYREDLDEWYLLQKGCPPEEE